MAQALQTGSLRKGESLITLENVSKTHDGLRTLFEGVTITIPRGARVAVVGPNGAGKTTLLRIISGDESADTGQVQRRRGITVGYLPQDPILPEKSTVLEAVLQADSAAAAAVQAYEEAAAAAAAAAASNGTGANAVRSRAALEAASDRMNALGAWELADEARRVLEAVGAPPPGARVGGLSGGQRRRVALAASLLSEPDLLVLDEPTNHMDLQAIQWLEERLAGDGVGASCLLVTHDRFFMESVCTAVLELDGGSAHLHSFGGPGSYKRFREAREERRAAQAALSAAATTKLRKEREWMSRQPQGRQTKAQARVARFYELTAVARSGPRDDTAIDFKGLRMARQGKSVLKLEGAHVEVAGRAIIKDFEWEFAPGECIGVVGPNGAGKSTLLDLIAGARQPVAGSRAAGENTVVGYFTQHMPPFPEEMRMIDYLRQESDLSSAEPDEAQLYSPEKVLQRLGFPIPRHHTQVRLLSGGERRRLQLASVLMARPNLLLMDEPTNDLDLATVEALEKLLSSYKGCLVIVSHDRAFMQNVANRLFVVRGDGIVRLFDGPYSEYLDILKEQEQDAAAAQATETQRLAKEEQPEAGAGNGAGPAANGAASAAGGVYKAPSAAKPENKLQRLSWREEQDYLKLEGVITKLEAERDALEERVRVLSAGGDLSELAAAAEKLARVTCEVDDKTEYWLELAERVEVHGLRQRQKA